MSVLSKKIAIDLGTANSVVYKAGEGIILNEPTVVAVTVDDRKVVAVGGAAKEMLGRTPTNISANRPMRDGVIADYAATEALLKYFIDKATGPSRFARPVVMVSVPAGVTSVESRAVLDATLSAGARKAYLIPEPLAAAIGAGIPISEARGNMIINSGGGTTEVAMVSLGGIVAQNSLRVGGNSLDASIVQHLRREYNLSVGEQTAEQIKIEIGSATPLEEGLRKDVRGRDSISGLPRTVNISSHEITKALRRPLSEMTQSVRRVLEKIPPELASDVVDRGMTMSGGTGTLRNLDKFLTKETGVPAHVADDPIFCVVRGCAKAIENIEVFRKNLTVR
ncbi:MAG: rod shape-determining protein [Patescibacteria group bacterium]|nr:rod shape-determining protein [Patescibacteria group bacterium]